ncbi:MAG: hypothetical protein WBM54_06205 [Woeseia sp.]
MRNEMLAALLAATLLPATVLAVETSFDGFLTIGAGKLSASGIDYAGYDDQWNFEPDTVSGLQLGVKFTERWSATGQLVIRGEDDFKPEIEWAYLSFAATDNLTFRAGRLRPPFFVVSDYFDVGYAYPWARPVEEVYINIPFTHYEGVDAVYRHSLGDWDMTLQGYYGSEDGDMEYRGSQIERALDNFGGIAATFDRNALSLRASHHRADLTFDSINARPLLAALRATPFASVADDLGIEQEAAAFTEVAATYDTEYWFVRAEATTTEFERGMVADQQSWYVTIGKYFEKFTPYLTYSELFADPDDGYSDPLPRGVDPGLDFLAANVDAIIASSRNEWSAISIGTRWNLLDNLAAKAEVTKVDRVSAGGTDFNVYSLVVNVLF